MTYSAALRHTVTDYQSGFCGIEPPPIMVQTTGTTGLLFELFFSRSRKWYAATAAFIAFSPGSMKGRGLRRIT